MYLLTYLIIFVATGTQGKNKHTVLSSAWPPPQVLISNIFKLWLQFVEGFTYEYI